MKRSVLFWSFLVGFSFIHWTLPGQTTRMGTPWVGKNYTSADYGVYAQPFLRKADMHWQSQDWEAALIALDHAVAQNPQSVEARLLRAQLKKLLGMETEAEQDVRVANQMNPQAADLYGFNGPKALREMLAVPKVPVLFELPLDRRQEIYSHWIDEVSKVEQTDWIKVEIVEELIHLLELGSLEEAKSLTAALVSLYPEQAIAHDLDGFVAYETKEYTRALNAWETALSFDEDFTYTWFNLGYYQLQRGAFNEGYAMLTKALSLDYRFPFADQLRDQLEEKDLLDDQQTIQKQSSITLICKEELHPLFETALAYKQEGQFGASLATVNQAIRLAPDQAVLYHLRGNVNLILGHREQALEDYTLALNGDENMAEAYYNRGLAHLIFLDPTSGCYDLQQAGDLGYSQAYETIQYFCVD